jgi:hypothetical protein
MKRSFQSPASRPMARSGVLDGEECKRARSSAQVFPYETKWFRPNPHHVEDSSRSVRVVTIALILTNLSRIPSTLPILVQSRRMLPVWSVLPLDCRPS